MKSLVFSQSSRNGKEDDVKMFECGERKNFIFHHTLSTKKTVRHHVSKHENAFNIKLKRNYGATLCFGLKDEIIFIDHLIKEKRD